MFIREWYYNVKRICRYIPVIWKDRDWDGWYFLEMMKFKLSRMETCLRNGCHVDCERDANRIRRVIWTIERLQKDSYKEEAMNELFDAKNTKDTMEWLNKPFTKEQQVQFRNLIDRQVKLRDQDKKYVFDNICKYIDTWWD